MRSLPARRPTVAATVLLGLALTACSQASPGVVAYVGDTEISQSQVDAAVDGLSSTLQAGQTVSTEAVVNALIQGELSDQIAVDRKISLTDAGRAAVLKGTELEPLVANEVTRPIAYDVADQAIVSNQLGPDGYFAEVGKHTVVLNPRYGVLDPKQKTITADKSGSLSVPAPAEATATP